MADEAPIAIFRHRGVRQSNYRDPIGVAPAGMDFYFDLKRLDTDDRSRINLRWHNKTIDCFSMSTFARNVFWIEGRVRLRCRFPPTGS
jgi:hypothetical protein